VGGLQQLPGTIATVAWYDCNSCLVRLQQLVGRLQQLGGTIATQNGPERLSNKGSPT